MYEDVMLAIALFVLFWVVVIWISRKYDLKKRGFSVSPGMIMWRTKRGLNFINRVAQAKRFWRVYGNLAVVSGIVLMVFVSITLVLNLFVLLTTPTVAVAGVQFVLPGLVPGLTWLVWIIGIATVLFVHEFAHGFLMRAQNLKTKSVGGMLFVAIPGAFVEPDEKQLTKAPVLKRLRVYAAGAFSNVLFAILILGIILLLLVPKPGVYVDAIAKGYPADNHNIGLGMRLYTINDLQMNNPDDFVTFMNMTQPGDKIRVVTSAGENVITLSQNPYNENVGYFGIRVISTISRWNFVNPLFVLGAAMAQLLGSNIFHPYIFSSLVPWVVIDILKWIFVLNIGIGLFNLLPAVPLDGGYMIRGILEKITTAERSVRISRAIAYIMLFIIIANFLLPFR
ncbi:MAG: site-2 protease family protein [Methanobacteriota archaeon]